MDKKNIISGLVAGLAMLIIGAMLGFAINVVVPSLEAEYSNSDLFRPFSDRIFISIYVVQPFIVGLLLSWIWSKVNLMMKEKESLRKGFRFGFVYWLLTLPGLMLAYASSPYSLFVVASWSIIGLAQALSAGLIIAKINK